jgi:hypothetical protein
MILIEVRRLAIEMCITDFAGTGSWCERFMRRNGLCMRTITTVRAFFLGGRRGTRTPKHFVNLTGESKNFKMLEFPLNKLQSLSIGCFYFFPI